MNDRALLIFDFLTNAGWGAAQVKKITGDASNRAYTRLILPEKTAILMDAPPASNPSQHSFVHIANHLRSAGFSAPEIYDTDINSGLLLIEDLGDMDFAHAISNAKVDPDTAYKIAIDTIVELQRTPPPDRLKTYGPKEMASAIFPLFEHYVPKQDEITEQAIYAELETVLALCSPESDVIIYRDYHTENLMWLPDRTGIARAGLIDFQDALIGHETYDIVSLLTDARRDISPDLHTTMTNRFIAATQMDEQEFRAAFAAQSIQRNLRILGIFAKLVGDNGKQKYAALFPRVWRYLLTSLSNTEMRRLRTLLLDYIPEPNVVFIKELQT